MGGLVFFTVLCRNPGYGTTRSNKCKEKSGPMGESISIGHKILYLKAMKVPVQESRVPTRFRTA